MADAIASLEAAKFSKPPKESWFTRIRTLSTWFSVKHDEFGRQVVCDMSTDKLVVPEQAWEALIFEAFETEANQHSTLTQKLIQSTVDKLSETHSMDGRRFGIPASFVKAKVSSRIPSLAAGRQGTDQSARGVPKPSLTCLDIHFFLNVAKALGDDGWTPQLVIDGEYNNDCALAHSGRVAAVFVTISFYPYSIICVLICKGHEPITMTRDRFILSSHFGKELDTYSAIVIGLQPGNNSEYCYQMCKSSTNEDVISPEMMENIVDNKPCVRTMRLGNRRVYVVDDFQSSSQQAYKSIASKSGTYYIIYITCNSASRT